MFDQLSTPVRSHALSTLLEYQQKYPTGVGVWTDFLIHDSNNTDYAYFTTPKTALYYPILGGRSDRQEEVVAALEMEFPWEALLEGILNTDDTDGDLVTVVEGSCSKQEYSFQVSATNATYLGQGDLSVDPSSIDAPPPVNSTYEGHALAVYSQLDMNMSMSMDNSSLCRVRLRVYATEEFRNSYMTNRPEIARAVVLAVFICFVGVFCVMIVLWKTNQIGW